MTMADTPSVMPAYLGWKNPESDKQNLRLYACDKEAPTAPRWSADTPSGRTIEAGLADHYGDYREGDRYLVVRVGDRFVPEEELARLTEQIQALIAELTQ